MEQIQVPYVLRCQTIHLTDKIHPADVCLLCSSKETLLLEWVNPLYLDISYQEQIQTEFEDSSEIQLKDFLRVTSY